jgi:hypothetical protein
MTTKTWEAIEAITMLLTWWTIGGLIAVAIVWSGQ